MTTIESEQDYKYSKIAVFLRADDKFIGDIRVKDGKIVFECSKEVSEAEISDLKNYLDTNIGLWETKGFTRWAGGRRPDGVMWDGIEKITVNHKDFITYVYLRVRDAKREVFNMKYIFVSSKGLGICIL